MYFVIPQSEATLLLLPSIGRLLLRAARSGAAVRPDARCDRFRCRKMRGGTVRASYSLFSHSILTLSWDIYAEHRAEMHSYELRC